MSIYSPPKMLIENYMVEIAKSFNVDFEPDPLLLLVSLLLHCTYDIPNKEYKQV